MDTFNANNFSCKLRQELPVKYQLACSLEFFMEELDRDKKIIFGCGLEARLEVRRTAEESRFLIRIYLLNHEKWSGNIDMSLASFLDIKNTRSKGDFVKRDNSQDDFTLTVESNDRQFRFSNRKGIEISINEEILNKMMSFESNINACQFGCMSEQVIYNEIINMANYRRNEKKTNDWVHEPPEWCKGGAETTLNKLIDQIRKAKSRNTLKMMNSAVP